MIKELHLTNFQGHKDSTIKLVSGVNVIAGQSNIGKSSIIRAVRWLMKNRPSGAGDQFRNRDADKKDEVSVRMELDDGSIIRFKRKGKNGYEVDGEQLVAIGTDVPTEVSNVLNLGDHNLQTQHKLPGSNPYFLVEDSPGDVARKLNEVCGMDIIDNCLSNAGLLVTRNQQQVSESQQHIEDLEESTTKYSDLEKREADVVALEKEWREIIKLDKKAHVLGGLIQGASRIQSDLDRVEELLKVEKLASKLFVIMEEREGAQNSVDQLSQLINKGRCLERDIVRVEVEIESMEDEFHDLLVEGGECPLCGMEIR